MKMGMVESIELLQEKVKKLESGGTPSPTPTPTSDIETAPTMTSVGIYNPFSEGDEEPKELGFDDFLTLLTTPMSSMPSRTILFSDDVSNFDLLQNVKPVNIELRIADPVYGFTNDKVKLELHTVTSGGSSITRNGTFCIEFGNYEGGQNVVHGAYGYASYDRTFNTEDDKRRILLTIMETYTR